MMITILRIFGAPVAFYLLLVPAVTLLALLALVVLAKAQRAPAAFRAFLAGGTLIVILILPWIAMITPKYSIGALPAIPSAQKELLTRHLSPPGVIPSGGPDSPEISKPSFPPRKDTNFVPGGIPQLLKLAIILGWFLGLLWHFGVFALGFLGLVRIRWSAHIVKEEDLLSALKLACSRLNYRKNVRLLLSDKISLPITWGWFWPIIALPVEARDWPAEQLDLALVHEIAHNKRRDFAVQTLSRLTCIIHWYNPLILRLFRTWKDEAEKACDDMVLCHGYAGDQYSEILLKVWQSATQLRPQNSLGLAMVRTSTLEERVTTILDEERSRTAMRPRKRRELLLTAGGLAFLIAATTLTRPTDYHLTPELRHDLDGIFRQAQLQEDLRVILQMHVEDQGEYWQPAKKKFVPQPQPTVADILLRLDGARLQYRAAYHPKVSPWINGPSDFSSENQIDTWDGAQAWTHYPHGDGFKWKNGGDISPLFVASFRAKQEVGEVVRSIQGKRYVPFDGQSYGIERTTLNGIPVVRLQAISTALDYTQSKTWWFDPQRNYALVQSESTGFGGKSPSFEYLVTITELQKIQSGVWYPTAFTRQDIDYLNYNSPSLSFRSTTKISGLTIVPKVDPALFKSP